MQNSQTINGRPVTTRQLEALLAVQETGSQTAAARKLGISVPVIHKYLSSIEEAAGAPILKTTPAGSKLTEEGQEIADVARSMDCRCERERGFTVCCSPVTEDLMMSVISSLRIPGANIVVSGDEYNIGMLREDRADLAIIDDPLSIAKNVAVDHGVPIGFFSLEMNNVQLVNRLISNVCEISGKKILNGQLDPSEWERLDKKIRSLTGAPIYIDDTPGLSVFELRTKARRLVREKGVKLLMIDYLQLMNANGMKFGSRQEEVSTISRSLKGLAKELNIPVLALSQLSRNVESREGLEGKRPQLSDLRESGAIEQDADMVLFVHRPEYYHIYQDEKGNDLHGMAQIIIAKHRKGATGDVLLNFRGEFTRFQDPTDSYTPVQEGGEIMGSKMNGGAADGMIASGAIPPPPMTGPDGPLPF